MAYLNVKCHLVYTMKIHKYERVLYLKGYALNVRHYGVLEEEKVVR